MVVSDAMVYGSTRLQKYGFLLAKQYKNETNRVSKATPPQGFYDDWEPLWFGPFSKKLAKDIDYCVKHGLIYKEPVKLSQNSFRYGLTPKGRMRWRDMLREFNDDMTAIREKVVNLQKVRLERLLEGIYRAYPEYTVNSVIKNKVKGD